MILYVNPCMIGLYSHHFFVLNSMKLKNNEYTLKSAVVFELLERKGYDCMYYDKLKKVIST